MADKTGLAQSQAGMRFIAQMHIYNSGSRERLAQFIADSYHPDQLEAQPLAERLAWFDRVRAERGKLRIWEIIAAEKHRVVVVMEAEKRDDLRGFDLQVEPDYPHKITDFYDIPVND